MQAQEEPRWLATIHYRFDMGVVGIVVGFEEFTDLGEVIEQGPDWDTIVEISITRMRDSDSALTVEQAAAR